MTRPAPTVTVPVEDMVDRFEAAAFATVQNLPRGAAARAEELARRDEEYHSARSALLAIAAASAAPQAAGVGEDKVRRLEAIARGYGSGWIVQDFDHGRMTGDDILELIAALRAPSREPEGGAVKEVTEADAPVHLSAEAAYGWACGYNAALATREEAPAEAGEDAEAIVRRWANWIIDESSDMDHDDHDAGKRKIRTERDFILRSLRAQPQAREDAQPVISAGRVLADALRQYGFPVSGGAKAALSDHGSAEALALNEACVAFLAALQAEQGAK